ncbi:MAG: helix-turn-helix domain-containing protein [Deltaproteobacteria bacterium]|nr:helix-turn-helix domain-containing protein [Deltaproteobacteria bacterium]
MVEDKDALSFGRYLMSIRLEKRISLEEISNETKIRVENLLLIEKEDLARLPEVYVKGFLRAYAKALGADEEEAVRRYESSRFILKKTDEYETGLENFSSKFWIRIVLCVGILLTIIVLSVFLSSIFQEQTSLNGQVNQQITGENIQENSIKFPENNDL